MLEVIHHVSQGRLTSISRSGLFLSLLTLARCSGCRRLALLLNLGLAWFASLFWLFVGG